MSSSAPERRRITAEAQVNDLRARLRTCRELLEEANQRTDKAHEQMRALNRDLGQAEALVTMLREAQPAKRTCGTCRLRDADGHCTSPKMDEDWGDPKPPDALVYSYSEGGSFWVGEQFGCVHHEVRQ